MLVLYSLLLLAYWLLVPTLISSLVRPPRRLGREGFAALLGIASWVAMVPFLVPILVWGGPKVLSPSVLGMLGVSLIAYLTLFSFGLKRAPKGHRPAGFGGDFLAIGVLSPVDEELLFRGILLTMAVPSLGAAISVLFTAVLFSLAHEAARIGGLRRTWRESLSDLAFGLLAGSLYLASGTILAPLALHVAVNAWHAYGRPADTSS